MPLVPIMPDFRGEQVHAAAAPVRAAGRAAEQLGDQLARRHALGQGVAVPAVRAEDDVVGPQMGTDAGGDRFLADVGVAGAVDQAALMRAGQLLLAAADQNHDSDTETRDGSGSDPLESIGRVDRLSFCYASTRNMIQVRDPHGLLGMDIADTESSADGPDPLLRLSLEKTLEKNLGQVRRCEFRPISTDPKTVQRFAEHVFYRLMTSIARSSQVNQSKCPQRRQGISGRIGWLDLDFGAADRQRLGWPSGVCEGSPSHLPSVTLVSSYGVTVAAALAQ